jgi:methyl-accepting chemotaxis protein
MTAAVPPATAPARVRSARTFWGDRPVRVKVLVAVGVTAVVAVLIGVLGLSALSATQQRQESLYVDVTIPIADLGEVDAALGESNFLLSELLMKTDPADDAAIVKEIADVDASLDESFASYTATDMTGREKARDGFAAALAQWRQVRDGQLVPMAQTAATAADFEALRAAQADALFDEANKNLDDLRGIEEKAGKTFVDESRAAYGSQRTLSIVLLVVGLVLAAGIGLAVARGIARGVRKVQDVAEALAVGDLTRSSGLTTQDELGQMGQSLDTAVANLRDVLSGVAASADAVAASSEELSASSAQISASAEETSAQSGVVSSAAEEVSRNVQTVAAGAEEMGASIREIASNAAEASEVAARAVTAAETTTATVAKLGESSAEIGNVVKVITSIAEQTNLLALNATIEAARAGEAGKGFAVVATEVKDLADQTAGATVRVTTQVERIREACEEVAAVMDKVGTTVTEMNGLVDGIAAAVDGTASMGAGASDITGLSQMAERLRSEATGFLAEMRR